MSIRALSPELAEKALKELNEDPKRTPSDIQHIKEWLSKQPHLRARTDDQWLLQFLRGCKFSLERTKEKIDLYYSMRTLTPEFFSIRPTDQIFKDIIGLGSFLILPKSKAFDGTRVTIVRPGSYDANKYNIIEVLAVSTILERIALAEDDDSVICGRRTILDLKGVTMGHFTQMTPVTMKKMVTIGQDAAPLRFKGAHYINLPGGFDVVFNAIKSLLNEKNKSRLIIHNENYEEMYKYIPQDILPAEYGGKAGTISDISGYWLKKTEEYSSWLEEDMKYGTDEAKRPGKPNSAADMFGVDGSFRKLDFDFNMNIRPLSPELAEKARLELNEDPKRIQSDIEHIKEWIAKQPHLRARTDDQWLLTFLRGCKYSLERTKEKIDLYYSFRTLAPELFLQRKHTDAVFQEILASGSCLVLPKKASPVAQSVLIGRPGVLDTEKYKVTDFMAVTNVIQKIMLLEDDNTVVAGARFVMDCENVNMSFFFQMTPTLMKKMSVYSQEAVPLRFKGGHYINVGSGFETIYNMMKRFLNEKTKSRLHVHNKNYEEMYQHIPKEILPVEYGGNGGTIAEIVEYWQKKIAEYSDWLEEDLQFGTDESKRPGKPKSAEEMFGLDGSFRQLEFD
ncbi:uncharacterized protein LOC125056869 [Pieris napi]|uniref:uncharacterized protein LOC125056869 n=1 Tax=Pieris napi TaxID=78633 RepID=UPI001FB94218|nr:uncharacterized protein LOC125056869 [Pieris napi]